MSKKDEKKLNLKLEKMDPNLKKWIGRKRFGFNDKISIQTNDFIEYLCRFYYFRRDQKKFEKHWTKCIVVREVLVEK